MKISIALATFNGGLHLRSQLDSLSAKTRLPDELIACDDGSADHTLDILKEFASTAPFPVSVYGNHERLEVRKNFERAVNLCEGDLIALCDQDDIWRGDKLELIEKAFSTSETGLVFSNAELVDKNLEAESRSLWQAVGFDSRRQRLARQGRMFEVL